MTKDRESGVALLSAILVLMLMSAMLVGFIAMVNADQSASGVNRDQTQAYAAAHAGVEKLTADLGQLFQTNFAPTTAEVGVLTVPALQPTLPGIQFLRPNGNPGYAITFNDVVAPFGEPDLETPGGSTISSGPYQGLVGLITPYNIEVTARTTGNAEVRMRRTMQTVAIPVFQFGIFSENDQSFFAGPNFSFGGRIHTNQHLFLKQDGPNNCAPNGLPCTLAIQDRVTAVGQVVRAELANGGTTHDGVVRMAFAAGCPNADVATDPLACADLADGDGSVVAGPTSALNGAWTALSTGTYNGWIRNGLTGARRLDLPLVSNGARPIDLLRRAPVGEAVTSPVGQQRFHNLATLRILLSDRPADIVGLPGVVTTAGVSPVPLSGGFFVSNAEDNFPGTITTGTHQFAASNGAATYAQLVQAGFRTTRGTSSVGGYIVINVQDRAGVWRDVTKEILNLGFAGRRLSSGANWAPNWNNDCTEAHPSAVIRVQRYSDTATAAQCANVNRTLVSLLPQDYWPNVLYDPREGMLRDDAAGAPVAPNPSGLANVGNLDPRLYWGGVMHYVELDVNNLRLWLNGTNGQNAWAGCAAGAGPNTCPMDDTGFVVYFSDRRNNRDDNGGFDAPAVSVPGVGGVQVTYGDDAETGELGYEDIINTTSTSLPASGGLDHFFTDAGGNFHSSEDLNWEQPTVPAANAPGRGTLQTYGNRARLLPRAALPRGTNPGPNFQLYLTNADNAYTASGDPNVVGTYTLYTTPVDKNVARVNRAFFFRRALKLVNGGYQQLPRNGTQGLTVTAENPVYIQGNYNACTAARPTTANNFAPPCVEPATPFGADPGIDHYSASVIADAVTLLSGAWSDIRSFNAPHSSGTGAVPAAYTNANFRQAATTYYRTAIISGKGYNFPRANTAPTAADHTDWGTDGGAHNFLRFIEAWNNAQLNYRGSIVSLYINRQAVGIYKCCNVVYGAPQRGYNFDTEFLSPTLLPPRTPMFRDLNTLTFRQVLRPTQ